MQPIPWNEERLARLSVCCCPNISSRTLARLSVAASWQDIWSAPPSKLKRFGVRTQSTEAFTSWRKRFDLGKLLNDLERDRISVVFAEDPGYPALLGATADPPHILFIRGELKTTPSVSVVGSRRMTEYGKRCVDELVPPLVDAGIAITSGLAFGVDGAAHSTTVERGGTTWAVLGTGIDEASLYPRAHAGLTHQILDGGGALISEFPPGTGSRKEHFPLRNRIIAGLSLATIVIEAREDSGSLITAKSALEENREVLAVPGPIWSDSSRGTNQLIRAGARVCLGADDVFSALALDRPQAVRQAMAGLPADPVDQKILQALDEPRHVDSLADLLHLGAPALASRLSLLELSGFIAPLGGQVWARAGQRRQVRQKG